MMDDFPADYASIAVAPPAAAVEAEAVELEWTSLSAALLSDESCPVGRHPGELAR
jgi:hypothetical protein